MTKAVQGGRVMLAALLLAAVAGLFEMGGLASSGMTPSVARRLLGLHTYAAVVTLVAVGILLLLGRVWVGAASRLRPWSGASRGGVWVSWWASTATFLGLLLAAEQRFWNSPVLYRRLALAAAIGAAIIVAFAVGLVARWAGKRLGPGPLRFLARPSLWTILAVAAVLFTLGRVWFSLPSEPDVRTRDFRGETRPPNFVIIAADTLRADVLGCYGGVSAATPAIDGLAARGALFESSVAPSSWTLPSVVSMLTSRYPREHGFVDFVDRFPEDVDDLAQVLARSGYRTYASIGNVLMTEWRGFGKGFQFYDVYGHMLESRLTASRALSGLLLLSGVQRSTDRGKRPLLWPMSQAPFVRIRWSHYTYDRETSRPILDLFESGIREPFFVYLHYVAPHEPYLRHPLRLLDSMPVTEEGNLDELRSRYLQEVQYLDSAVGELLAGLDNAGLGEQTVVAFVADHGEAFLEHDRWGHGRDLYQEVIAIPTILTGPGIPSRRISVPVSLIDLAPTLLDLAGLESPESFRGRSLLGLLGDGDARFEERPVFAETSSKMLTPDDTYEAVLHERYKLVRRFDREGGDFEIEVYDLASDPEERSPLVDEEIAARLGGFLDLFARVGRELPDAELEEDELEALRALGYVN